MVVVDQSCRNLSFRSIRTKHIGKYDFCFLKYCFSTVKLSRLFFSSMHKNPAFAIPVL